MKLTILAAALALGLAGCANVSIGPSTGAKAATASSAATVTIRDGYVVVDQDPLFARAAGPNAPAATVSWKIGTPGATFTKDGITVDVRVKDLPKPVKETDARRATSKLNDVESAKRVKCAPDKERTTFTCEFPKGLASGLYAYTIRVSYKGMVYEHDPLVITDFD
jgi:hypothetical protein